jgi:hypothetical protein
MHALSSSLDTCGDRRSRVRCATSSSRCCLKLGASSASSDASSSALYDDGFARHSVVRMESASRSACSFSCCSSSVCQRAGQLGISMRSSGAYMHAEALALQQRKEHLATSGQPLRSAPLAGCPPSPQCCGGDARMQPMRRRSPANWRLQRSRGVSRASGGTPAARTVTTVVVADLLLDAVEALKERLVRTDHEEADLKVAVACARGSARRRRCEERC